MEGEGLGFVVIAGDQLEETIDAGRGGPGDYVPFDETLYAGSPDSWEPGAQIGSASGFTLRTPGPFVLYHVILDLGDGNSLVAAGRLPYDTSPKAGVIPVTGSSGRYGNAGGRLKVEFKNPKRYTYEP